VLPVARDVAQRSEFAYSRGATSVLDLLDARRSLKSVELDAMQARADAAKAWARRAAILWAFVPMMAIGVIEKLVFNTSYFGGFVENRVAGGADIVESSVRGLAQLSPMTHITPGRFLENPGLWGGLLFGGLFLAAAARIRRYRGPM